MLFPGFDSQINRRQWVETVQMPDRIYSVDGKRFLPVHLDRMEVPSDGDGNTTFKFNEALRSFARIEAPSKT